VIQVLAQIPLMQNGMPLEGAAAGERQLDFGSVQISENGGPKDEAKLSNVSPLPATLSPSKCAGVQDGDLNCTAALTGVWFMLEEIAGRHLCPIPIFSDNTSNSRYEPSFQHIK